MNDAENDLSVEDNQIDLISVKWEVDIVLHDFVSFDLFIFREFLCESHLNQHQRNFFACFCVSRHSDLSKILSNTKNSVK